MIRKNKKFKTGWEVLLSFRINLHKKDLALLERVQAFYAVGTISKGKDFACFSVQSIKDLINVIIPHFDKYPLVGDKQADFLLFRSIVELMNKKKHLTIEGLHEILSISASLNRGLSEELVKAFPSRHFSKKK